MLGQAYGSTIPLGLIFTDVKGQVVFVDYYFLHLVRCRNADQVIGSPLHETLGINAQLSRQFLKAITRDGFVHQLPLDIQSATGELIPVLCAGVATYDDRDTLIGIDISLFDPADAELPGTLMTHHQEVIGSHIQGMYLPAQSYAQIYVRAQIGGLQILLARMGGPRIRETLNVLLDKLINRHGWPMRIEAGQVAFDDDELDPTIYLTLMTEVARYATNVIGRRMVMQELQTVDGQMDQAAIEAVHPLGLRQLIETIH